MAAQLSRIQRGRRDIEGDNEELIINGTLSSASLASVDSAVNMVYRAIEPDFERLESFKKTMKTYFGVLFICFSCNNKILDCPDLVQRKWNKMLLVPCVMALSLDPLFCYTLVVNDEKKCLGLDRTVGAIASVLRSVGDCFYLFYIIYQFRASVVTLSFGSSLLKEDRHTRARAWKYLLSCFIFDILVILPLPQVLMLYVIPKLNDSRVYNATELMHFTFFLHYVLRVARIYFLLRNATRARSIPFPESTWPNLFFFMLAGHVVGSFWYLFSIERKATCWLEVCKSFGVDCSLYCDGTFKTTTYLKDSCSSKSFDYGIYSDAIESGVVDSVDFIQRISYCFWWGLQNLSSLGQSLKTSTYVWEIYFSIFILIFGLVLVAALIGTMQTHLMSKIGGDEMKRKRKAKEKRKREAADTEVVMSFYSLPQTLKKRILQYQTHKCEETTRVDVLSFLDSLPWDLRRETKQHLCSTQLSKVPMLQNMDKRLFDAICDHLKPVLYKELSVILRKGDPLGEMLFITRGTVLTYATADRALAGAYWLEKGDFYGQELLDWVLKNPNRNRSVSKLPVSTKTVQAHTKVEVFVLRANDWKSIVIKFWWLFPHISEQWRIPRAVFAVQAAWRRYKLKKTQQSKEGSVSNTDTVPALLVT